MFHSPPERPTRGILTIKIGVCIANPFIVIGGADVDGKDVLEISINDVPYTVIGTQRAVCAGRSRGTIAITVAVGPKRGSPVKVTHVLTLSKERARL